MLSEVDLSVVGPFFAQQAHDWLAQLGPYEVALEVEGVAKVAAIAAPAKRVVQQVDVLVVAAVS